MPRKLHDSLLLTTLTLAVIVGKVVSSALSDSHASASHRQVEMLARAAEADNGEASAQSVQSAPCPPIPTTSMPTPTHPCGDARNESDDSPGWH